MIFESNVMNINFKNAVSYLTFKNLEKYKFFKHAYSTRLGGVSKNEYKSLNFSFSCGDEKTNVEENYNIFCDCLGIKKEKLAITSQIHEDNIKCVKEINEFTCFKDTDALITDKLGVTLATFHADCLAVYMIDPKKKVVGLAHAGWRGTVKNIASKLAKKFVDEYESVPKDIVCALGPSIGKCCFEVSKPVLEKFNLLDIPKTYIHDKNRIDLVEVNKQLLIKFGLKEENIICSDVCTMCNKDMLFSHRATNGKRGCNCAFISLV